MSLNITAAQNDLDLAAYEKAHAYQNISQNASVQAESHRLAGLSIFALLSEIMALGQKYASQMRDFAMGNAPLLEQKYYERALKARDDRTSSAEKDLSAQSKNADGKIFAGVLSALVGCAGVGGAYLSKIGETSLAVASIANGVAGALGSTITSSTERWTVSTSTAAQILNAQADFMRQSLGPYESFAQRLHGLFQQMMSQFESVSNTNVEIHRNLTDVAKIPLS